MSPCNLVTALSAKYPLLSWLIFDAREKDLLAREVDPEEIKALRKCIIVNDALPSEFASLEVLNLHYKPKLKSAKRKKLP